MKVRVLEVSVERCGVLPQLDDLNATRVYRVGGDRVREAPGLIVAGGTLEIDRGCNHGIAIGRFDIDPANDRDHLLCSHGRYS